MQEKQEKAQEQTTVSETISDKIIQRMKEWKDLLRKRKGLVLLIIGGFIGLLLFARFSKEAYCNIPPGERGLLVKRFSGRNQSRILEEGGHIIIPGFQTVYNVRVHRQSAAVERITADSREFQDVALWLNIEFQLQEDSLIEFFQTYGIMSSARIIEEIIIPNTNEVTKNIIIDYRITDILVSQGEIKKQITEGLRRVLAPYYIDVVDVDIENIRLDPEFRELIADVEFAEYEKQRETIQLEIAQRNAEIRILEAETLKREKIIQAEAEAEYNRALNQQTISEAMLEYKKLENARAAIEKWNGEFPGQTGAVSDWPF